jgi:Zn-dependent peptidase ImmA (M78 family)
VTKSKIEFPFLKDSNIEKETLGLLSSYAEERGKEIKAPIDVLDIIEYLDYDIDFRKDDIYEDENILGGLRISNKMVEINDNLSGPQGRRSFTMAHETGHIVLHVPYYLEQEKIGQKGKSEIICRKDEGFEGNKKAPEEWQADKFAAYLLMPTAMVKKVFFQSQKRSVNVRRKSLLGIIFPKSPIRKAYQLAENVIQAGNFSNVSKMAMLNRLIGLRLVRGLSFQKSKIK